MTTMIYFDTLEYVETLQAAGVSEKQARAFAKVQKASLSECLDTTLATKADMQDLRIATKADMHDLRVATKADMQELRDGTKADMQELRDGTKADMQGLRDGTKADMQNMKMEMTERFNHVESDIKLLQWMMGFMMAGVGTLILKAFF